jgi:membrane-bound lytic murein transglycosylase B
MINKGTILLASLTLLCLEISSKEDFDYSSREDVKEYIKEISSKHGFDSNKLSKLLGGAVYQEKVIRIMNRQPEGTMTWSRYKKMMVSDSRISAGEEFINLYKEDLKRAEDLYGVPAEIIASIIGIETRYGRITGNIRVLDSLMTLSFNYPRRSKFFKIQLEEFLLLSREEGFNPESLKGSIAGAMGYGQFMPDSYRKYAVDFDSDGVKDILTNPVDAIGSVANFLSKKGKWKPNTQIAIKARSISNQTSFQSKFKPYMTVIELNEIGLVPEVGISGNLKFVPISLELDEGYEYWLGFDNYNSLSRYNRSKLYVMAVIEFSRSLSIYLH